MRIPWRPIRTMLYRSIPVAAIAALVVGLASGGCALSPRLPKGVTPPRGAFHLLTDSYWPLDLIAAAGCLLGFGMFVASFWVPEVFPRKTSAALVLSAVVAWVLKSLLLNFLPFLVWAIVAISLATAVLFLLGHWRLIRAWAGLDRPSPVFPALQPDPPEPAETAGAALGAPA